MRSANQSCADCGRPLDFAGRCPNCDSEDVAFHRQKLILPILALVLIAAFSFTRMVVRWHDDRQEQLATRWYNRGIRGLAANHPDQAAEAFETALVYAKQDNQEYSLRLAQALVAAGRTDEALSRLLNLWNERPADAALNLSLARLEAKRGDPGDAARYYHLAIEGVWTGESNPAAQRLKTRFELAELLAARHQNDEAEAELVTLAPELPADPAAHTRLGQLLLEIGDAHEALAEFQKARQLNREFAPAAAGAGAAELQLGDMPSAKRYLLDALRLNEQDAKTKELLERADLLLAADPFSTGVSASERAHRAIAAYEAAVKRLESCAQTASQIDSNSAARRATTGGAQAKTAAAQLAQLRPWAAQLRPYAQEHTLRGRDDVVENMMRFVFAAEDASTRACGPPSGLDDLLSAIGRHRWRSE